MQIMLFALSNRENRQHLIRQMAYLQMFCHKKKHGDTWFYWQWILFVELINYALNRQCLRLTLEDLINYLLVDNLLKGIKI